MNEISERKKWPRRKHKDNVTDPSFFCSLIMFSPIISRQALRTPSIFRSRLFHTTSSIYQIYKDVSSDSFKTLIKATQDQNRILIVDFYADWCGPCKILGPILEKVVEDPELSDSRGQPYDLATIDTETEEGMSMSKMYSVRALPTVVAFKNGLPVNRFVGAVPESGVRKFIETL
ncbi:thioredoxin-like protein [Flagelloscypha sp. PMI_526]|nr:thioredoxin-like protein [Flagelloscypha sp. PMI_526]